MSARIDVRLRSATAALCATLLGASAARADDTEIFVNSASAAGMRPNIVFILDTSDAMDALVSTGKAPYDSTRIYVGDCPANRVYWRRYPSEAPSCDSLSYVLEERNHCNAATLSLDGSAGLWTGRAFQRDGDRWDSLDRRERDDPEAWVECEADAGTHGQNDVTGAPWAARKGKTPWTSKSEDKVSWGGANRYTLYSANWLNWLYSPPDSSPLTRFDAMKGAATTILNSLDGVNVGLMTFSGNLHGGMVTDAVADIGSNRAALLTRLDTLDADAAGTPLSETLYEAAQYFAGRAVDFGLASTASDGSSFPSVQESRNADDTYRSPVEFQCQRNFIILMSHGEPAADSDAESQITGLPDFSSIVSPTCSGASEHGRCLDELARYMNQADIARGSGMDGVQNVVTYTVGLGSNSAGSSILAGVAAAGGGESFAADDVLGLTTALQAIVSNIAERSSSFTAPSVAVNAFNRTQTTDELYISVFGPTDTARWPGNLKKYALDEGRIVDADGEDAIDPDTGFFSQDARSFWTAGAPDGRRVAIGGAASRLPDVAERKVYTFIESLDERSLASPTNAFSSGNAALTDELLGTSDVEPTRSQLIDWARGVDVRDADGDGDRTEQNRFMGDPLHARPVLVTYGRTTGEGVVFTPTNDGFLHATNADSGEELWAFIPEALLTRLPELYHNSGVSNRSYGLDSDVRVLRFDVDQDGEVEAADGDRVFIYFGMRRGGNSYYALDVTDRTNPKLLWRIGTTATTGADVLPGVGQTWSTPGIARVRVSGEDQNPEKLVLIFGGGYDTAQDDFTFTADGFGHRIYMVDAVTGALLWYAGGPGGTGTPDRLLAQMTHSIPARVNVIDNDGDGFADRMYTADTGGRVWRFDIWNDREREALVTGGVLANLGAAGMSTPAATDTRRFYYAPDVALIQRRGSEPYYNLAIGSGYREHPLHVETRNSFYSLRDRNPFGRLDQNAYDALTPITDAQLTEAKSAIGWKLDLDNNGPGEKVLAEAVTVNGTVLFPTYEPQSADSDNPCVPANGINRAYALQVETARPAIDFNDDGEITDADAWTRLAQTGIAGEVTFALESRSGSDGGGEGGSEDDPASGPRDALGRRPVCLIGVEVLQKCVAPGDVVRTFWQRSGTN